MGSSFLVTYAKLKLEHKQSFVHRTKMLTIVNYITEVFGNESF